MLNFFGNTTLVFCNAKNVIKTTSKIALYTFEQHLSLLKKPPRMLATTHSVTNI